jgi:hypothetical protein
MNEESHDLIRKIEKAQKENSYLKEREKHFRRIVRAKKLSLTIEWLTKFESINLSALKTPLDLVNLPNNYQIIWANTDTLCENMGKGMAKIFPKDNLWEHRMSNN